MPSFSFWCTSSSTHSSTVSLHPNPSSHNPNPNPDAAVALDLFAFIIKMPTMHRLSVFRDDIVFFIYIYQRWIYRVDSSRPVEK